MTPDRLAGHFARIADAPNAIPRLRQFILDLAVRGKLVEQNHKDESASDLLRRIETEKELLIQNEILAKDKPLPLVAKGEAPFVVPPNWSWTRIGTCSSLIEYGTSERSDHGENGIPVLKMGDIQNGQLILGGQKKVPQEIDDLPKLYLKRFDLLYNRTNSAELVGKTGIFLGEDHSYTFASYLIRIRFLHELTSPPYVNIAMNAPYFRETQIVPQLQQQCGQANVNGTKLRNMIIPFPPLAEQHRIVAKVDELMALCDRLEAAQAERESRRDRLAAASLHRLNQPADATTVREHARFHLSHLQRLTIRSEQIQQLRKAILSFGVRGQLVAQNPHDESAVMLVRRSTEENPRAQLRKPSERPVDIGERYVLPVGWAWFKGEQIAEFVDPQPSHRTPPEHPGGVAYVGYADIGKDGYIDFKNARKVSSNVLDEQRQRYKLKNGDFIIGKIGTIGRPFLLPEPFNYTISANVILIQPNSDLVLSSYLVFFLQSPIAEQALRKHQTDSTHAVFGIKKAREVLIPLPPLAEQHRIVAKVDELMALCDRLEAQLTTTQTQSRRLLEAVLHEALAGA